LLLGYLLMLGVAWASSAHWFAFTDVAELYANQPEERWLSAAAMWSMVPELVLHTVVPPLAFLGVGFAVGALATTGFWSLVGTLGGLAAFDYLRVVATQQGWSGLLPTAHVPSPLVGDTSYLPFYIDTVTGHIDARFPMRALALTVPLAYAGLALGLAVLLFRRRPVP